MKPFLYTMQFGKDRYHEIDKMSSWCYDNLGMRDAYEGVWECYQMFGNTTFSFKHEKDAVLFTLRWS